MLVARPAAHAHSKKPVLRQTPGMARDKHMEPLSQFEGHQANGRGWLDRKGVAGRRARRRPDDAGAFASAGVPAMKRTSLNRTGLVPLFGKAHTMTLFVAIHQHAPERCPAGNPAMGPALLDHLSAATAGQYGVSVRAEAVANDKHTLYLIAEAADDEQLRRYLAPFAQAGSVEVLPASPCEAVINRGGCAQVAA